MAARKYTYVDFRRHQPICNTPAVAQIGVVTDTAVNFWHAGDVTFESYNEQANADIIPTKLLDADGDGGSGAGGWQIPNDNADNDGIQVTQGILSDANEPYAFTVGTHPCKLEVKLSIPDVSDYDVCAIGFRIAGAYVDAINAPAALLAAYSDKFVVNIEAGDVHTAASLNGSDTETDVSVTNVADDDAPVITVAVDSDGVATCQLDGTTLTHTAHTFDTGDIIVPTMIFCKGGNAADTPPILMTYLCTIQ